jgi:ASC-1-like (ASCH) protein
MLGSTERRSTLRLQKARDQIDIYESVVAGIKKHEKRIQQPQTQQAPGPSSLSPQLSTPSAGNFLTGTRTSYPSPSCSHFFAPPTVDKLRKWEKAKEQYREKLKEAYKEECVAECAVEKARREMQEVVEEMREKGYGVPDGDDKVEVGGKGRRILGLG